MSQYLSAIQSQARLFWLVGDELFLKRQFIDQLEHYYYPDPQAEPSFHQFYGDSFNLGQFMNAMFDTPLFGGCSIIVLKNMEKLKKNDVVGIRKAIEAFPADTVLVLDSEKLTHDEIGKLVIKKGVMIECKSLNDQKAIHWVVDYAREHYQRQIRSEDAQLLVSLIGTTLSLLASELEKLDLHLKSDQSINPRIIRMVCNGNRSYGVFDLTNAVLDRDLYKAFRILHYLLQEGTPGLQISSLLSRCVTNAILLYESDQSIRVGNGRNSSPIPPFLVQRYRKFLNGYPNPQTLVSLLIACLDVDIKLKSSGSDHHDRWLEKMIMQMILGQL